MYISIYVYIYNMYMHIDIRECVQREGRGGRGCMKECHDNPGVKFVNGTTISKRCLEFVFEQAPMIQVPVFKKHDRPRTKSGGIKRARKQQHE